MTNIQEIIDDSALPIELKTTLKSLVEQFLALDEQEGQLSYVIFNSKAEINERQYAQRLLQPMTNEKRNQVVANQFASKDRFVNAVLQVQEMRLHLESLARYISKKIAEAAPLADAKTKLALVALTSMLRNAHFKPANSNHPDLDNVAGLNRQQLLDAVRTVFKSKKKDLAFFASAKLRSNPIVMLQPSPLQELLLTAADSARAAAARFEKCSREFFAVLINWNVPQFTQRMEQALTVGNQELFDRVSKEQKDVEARLFLAATSYEHAFSGFAGEKEQFATVIREAAETIKDLDSEDGIKAISSCNGAWHGLQEMEDKEHWYKIGNPSAVLKRLEFDAAAYITSDPLCAPDQNKK
jgi:hypothetical protein